MRCNRSRLQYFAAGVLAACAMYGIPGAVAQLNTGEPQILSTSQLITILAPNGARFQPLNPNLADNPEYTAGQAVTTIEDVLGTPHLNLNDANTLPMVDAFDLDQKTWKFTAVPSALLSGTTLPIPVSVFNSHGVVVGSLKPLHDATWWANATKGMDFSVEDHLDSNKYNRILWAGTMGDKPYPDFRSGLDLRANRAELLRNFRQRQAAPPAATESRPKEPAQAGPAGSSR
ncbi:MAG: hypothetical protein WBE76_23120 [Terracidiphilus sp.]